MMLGKHVKVGISLALIVSAFYGGWKARDLDARATMANLLLDWSEASKAASDRTLEVERARGELANVRRQLRLERERDAEVVTETIEKEVVRYVETPAAVDCGLDPDGMFVHNAAATRRLSEAAAARPGVDGAATGDARDVPAGEVVEVVARNYDACFREFRRVRDLQQYVKDQCDPGVGE